MKKNVPLSPSSFHISNEGEKKNINLHPPFPSTVKKRRKKIKVHPFPRRIMNRIETLALLNSKK
jgi:hypothetical protein